MHWKSSSQLVLCIWWKIALVILILVKQIFLFLNDLLGLFIFWEFWFHAHQLNNLPFCSVAIFSKITLSSGRIPVQTWRISSWTIQQLPSCQNNLVTIFLYLRQIGGLPWFWFLNDLSDEYQKQWINASGLVGAFICKYFQNITS